jgi:hypothetical protein
LQAALGHKDPAGSKRTDGLERDRDVRASIRNITTRAVFSNTVIIESLPPRPDKTITVSDCRVVVSEAIVWSVLCPLELCT